MTEQTGVRAASTLAGFNICEYAGGQASPADFDALEQYMGEAREQMFFPVQTHSAEVRTVPCDAEELVGVDAVVTDVPGVVVGVHTADCLPLLMADVEMGIVAAVHCGWRGTVAGIARKALRQMVKLGARTERVVATMGPHICPECFEVGEDVALQFPEEAVVRMQGQKPHVSLATAVTMQLQAEGVIKIERPCICSKCNERFYSVRRQGYELTERTLTAIKCERVQS